NRTVHVLVLFNLECGGPRRFPCFVFAVEVMGKDGKGRGPPPPKLKSARSIAAVLTGSAPRLPAGLPRANPPFPGASPPVPPTPPASRAARQSSPLPCSPCRSGNRAERQRRYYRSVAAAEP